MIQHADPEPVPKKEAKGSLFGNLFGKKENAGEQTVPQEPIYFEDDIVINNVYRQEHQN